MSHFNGSTPTTIRSIGALLFLCSMVASLISCNYLKYSSVQAKYSRLQNAEPGQVNLKHLLDRDTFYVFGKVIDKSGSYANTVMAIAAYSNKYKKNERVDTMYFKGAGRHYGLNLPEGRYTLLVYADLNEDGVFAPTETLATRELDIGINQAREKVLGQVDILLGTIEPRDWADSIPVPEFGEKTPSLFFPTGSIRSLHDPIFDEKIATLGMYDPASFLEYAPTMFYAGEEDIAHKVPVIFVHGIGGSSRDFNAIVERMDQSRYKAWYFYYPSGGDLDQLAAFFHTIFLSGKVIPMREMPMVVVAHSMGGLIVREAINKYKGTDKENRIELLVTIASPFGGHPAAAAGEKHGLIVLPAWRDLNPDSRFIRQLYRKPLPDFTNHQLFYAYENTSTVKFGSNSDGVVPLASQLQTSAQKQSRAQFGFNSGHVEILQKEAMITHLLEKISAVQSIFPESHIQVLTQGGFDAPLDDRYSPLARHVIQYAGKYLVLLINGVIEPIDREQEKFIRSMRGQEQTTDDLARELGMFLNEHPELVKSLLQNGASETTGRQD